MAAGTAEGSLPARDGQIASESYVMVWDSGTERWEYNLYGSLSLPCAKILKTT